MTATKTQYETLDKTFAYFNQKLFKGELPDVLITLQRKPKSKGYYHADVFNEREGKGKIAEIALNPDSFHQRTDQEILSTLTHEMTHHWQQVFGDAPKRCYHDREWASKTKEVGLYPSST